MKFRNLAVLAASIFAFNTVHASDFPFQVTCTSEADPNVTININSDRGYGFQKFKTQRRALIGLGQAPLQLVESDGGVYKFEGNGENSLIEILYDSNEGTLDFQEGMFPELFNNCEEIEENPIFNMFG